MGVTLYDENGKTRGETENGRFDRDYYNIDENGDLAGYKSFLK